MLFSTPLLPSTARFFLHLWLSAPPVRPTQLCDDDMMTTTSDNLAADMIVLDVPAGLIPRVRGSRRLGTVQWSQPAANLAQDDGAAGVDQRTAAQLALLPNPASPFRG